MHTGLISGGDNDHVPAFLEIGQFFFIFDNLGYSLLKNVRYLNFASHVEVFSRTPLCLVLWANAFPRG